MTQKKTLTEKEFKEIAEKTFQNRY